MDVSHRDPFQLNFTGPWDLRDTLYLYCTLWTLSMDIQHPKMTRRRILTRFGWINGDMSNRKLTIPILSRQRRSTISPLPTPKRQSSHYYFFLADISIILATFQRSRSVLDTAPKQGNIQQLVIMQTPTYLALTCAFIVTEQGLEEVILSRILYKTKDKKR